MIAEPGSELAIELRGTRHRAASSVLVYPEARAALAAARRARRLTPKAHATAIDALDAVHRKLLLVGVDSELARDAGRLADKRGLRGFDAVHLASALALGTPTTVVTRDAALAAAALACGCAVAPAV